MSEIKFNDHIKTVEETLAKIKGIRKEAEEKLVPEIRHELDMTLADLVELLNSFKTDIAAISRIYAVREDIQSTILSPVTQKINEATAHSVSEIKNESLSGVLATRKWTIISIVVAFLFAMFLNRGLDSLILFLKKCYAPKVSYQVGIFSSEEKTFFSTTGAGPKLPLSGDPSAMGRIQLNKQYSGQTEEVWFSFDGKGFFINEFIISPEDDLLFATVGNSLLPAVSNHPLSINKRNLVFSSNPSSPFNLPQDGGGTGTTITLVNFSKKKPFKFRIIGKIFVPGYLLGWPGKLWGGQDFTYYQDFQFSGSKEPWASGAYLLW